MKNIILLVAFILPVFVKAEAAELKAVGLAFQVVFNVYGLTNNMVDNANRYKIDITTNLVSPAVVRAVIIKDADEYIRRIKWFEDAYARNPTDAVAALDVFGIGLGPLNTFLQTLKTAALDIKSADLSTGPNIMTEANNMLAVLPIFERLW